MRYLRCRFLNASTSRKLSKTTILKKNLVSPELRVLFLYPYPADSAPSQRFRFEQYLHFLEQHEFKLTRQSFWSGPTWKILYEPGFRLAKIAGILKGFGRRLLMLTKLWGYDWVFVHREITPVGPPIFEWIISRLFKKKIIFDFDDAIWLPNTSNENQIVSNFKWHSKVTSICRLSSRVSAGNEFLANYARQFASEVKINPTTIDTESLHNPDLYIDQNSQEGNGSPVIGWTGTHSTLPFLKSIIPVIEDLQRSNDFSFMVISDRRPDFELDCLVYIPWRKETEILDLLKIHIGVMPIPDSPWAQGKCGFKLLQFMALKIPVVASPVGVNSQIIDSGEQGFLCIDHDTWHDRLERLLDDPSLRKSMGNKGRTRVQNDYAVSSNRDNFLSLFK